MANRYKLDQLNTVESYERFFGEMRLERQEMLDRLELAYILDEIIDYIFYVVTIFESTDTTDAKAIKDTVKPHFIGALAEKIVVDEYVENLADELLEEVISTTIKKMAKAQEVNEPVDDEEEVEENKPLDVTPSKKQKDDATSDDRKRFIVGDLVNTFMNYEQYQEAIVSGKKKKKWLSMRDEKVRLAHALTDGETVDIDMPFDVGGSLMMFPKDTSLGADPVQIVNCRCTVEYKDN